MYTNEDVDMLVKDKNTDTLDVFIEGGYVDE